jgi:hypothetical protein
MGSRSEPPAARLVAGHLDNAVFAGWQRLFEQGVVGVGSIGRAVVDEGGREPAVALGLEATKEETRRPVTDR